MNVTDSPRVPRVRHPCPELMPRSMFSATIVAIRTTSNQIIGRGYVNHSSSQDLLERIHMVEAAAAIILSLFLECMLIIHHVGVSTYTHLPVQIYRRAGILRDNGRLDLAQ